VEREDGGDDDDGRDATTTTTHRARRKDALVEGPNAVHVRPRPRGDALAVAQLVMQVERRRGREAHGDGEATPSPPAASRARDVSTLLSNCSGRRVRVQSSKPRARAQVRSIQKFFTHRSVSTFDRVSVQLTDELFLYGMAL
jgi:hypothetical protein